MRKHLRRKLEKWLLKHLLNAVTEDELLLSLEKNEASNLQLQATDYVLKDSLFNTLLTDADRVASIKMFRKSENLEDIRFARTMLYCTDVLRKKARHLANTQPELAQRVGRE